VKIEYERGQILGDYGVVYLKEVETEGRNRKAEFKCGRCGAHFIAQIYDVKRNHSTSCGCYRKQRALDANTTHGKTSHKLYWVWQSMKARCTSRKASRFMDYGGRGIGMCEEWLVFESFFSWALQNGYTEVMEIDRIDNDGNYSPSNCRFVDRSINTQNTRLLKKNNTSGFRGVSKYGERFISKVNINKNTIHIGYYITKEQGAQAYDVAVILLDGLHPRNFKEYELKDYDQGIVEEVKNKIKEYNER
jgi:hypothetical protein